MLVEVEIPFGDRAGQMDELVRREGLKAVPRRLVDLVIGRRGERPHGRRLPGATRWVLCAVQALHPFYNRAGEVIASWMTREQREHAIQDNLGYVAGVVAEVKRELPVSERLAYLGFSQGAAMAYRAAAGSGHACQGVVVLGGDLPPELAPRDLSHFPPVLLGRGSSEEWYDAAKMEHDVELLRRKGVDIRPCVFQGGHEWTNEFRAEASRFLEEVFRPAS